MSSTTPSDSSDSDPFVDKTNTTTTTTNNNNNNNNNSSNTDEGDSNGSSGGSTSTNNGTNDQPPSPTTPLTPPRSPLRLLSSISESNPPDGSPQDEQASKEAAAEAGMTSLPLRVPAKSARRQGQQMPPPPAYAGPNGNGMSRTGSAHSSNNGYGYTASVSSGGTGAAGGAAVPNWGAFGAGAYPDGVHPSVPMPGRTMPQDATMSSQGSGKEGRYAGEGPGDGEEEEKKGLSALLGKFGIDEGNWSSDRRRRCRFLTVVVVVILAIVGITVGLGVGLTQGSSGRTTSPDSSPSDSGSNPEFPSGSYTLNTTLQSQSTGCTSKPSTWRCFPYTTGQAASFTWTILPSSSNQGSYTVSSSDNPFAPVFTNISLTLADQGLATEHYYFSFNMNRTVTPSDALTAGDRAAQCTYANTQFLGTLWTRRHGGKDVSPPKDGGVKWEDWPGDVEVTQVAQSHTGEPRCVDSAGQYIADVQAGQGQCLCQYGSFDISTAGGLSGLQQQL